MLKIYLLSDSGSNYFFNQGNIVGVEKNRMVKYVLSNNNPQKAIEFYGGLKLDLYDGKHLIAKNKTFYITE